MTVSWVCLSIKHGCSQEMNLKIFFSGLTSMDQSAAELENMVQKPNKNLQ